MNIQFLSLDDRGAGLLAIRGHGQRVLLERHVVELASGTEAWWFKSSGELLARFPLPAESESCPPENMEKDLMEKAACRLLRSKEP